jgi:hypothetical protein
MQDNNSPLQITMNANNKNSVVVLSGVTPKSGYAYQIKRNPKGQFDLSANEVTLNGLTFPTIRHTSKSFSYLKKWVEKY